MLCWGVVVCNGQEELLKPAVELSDVTADDDADCTSGLQVQAEIDGRIDGWRDGEFDT